MNQLDQIKKYAELLSKASKWSSSGEQILNIESMTEGDNKKEYIYEFYCFLRIIEDLRHSFDIEMVNIGKNKVFPKAPASKKNYPFFIVKDKNSGNKLFEICTSIDIIGLAGETSAPDISFLHSNGKTVPSYEDVFMLFDAKYKHDLSTNVHESEFQKVASMVINLDTKDASKNTTVLFNELVKFLGNCLITNSSAYKTNAKHHELFSIKEVESFDVGKTFNVIG